MRKWILAAAAAAIFVAPGIASAQSPILIKFSHVVAPNTPKGKGAERFKELAEKFICVKIDPREVGAGHDAMRLKSTRYVPEIVLINSRGEVAESVEQGFDVETVAAAMERTLKR